MLEAILFCCLSALVLFWTADRLRGVDFTPISVVPCAGTACVAYMGPPEGSPLAVFTQAMAPRGVVSFSATNLCVSLADALQYRGPQGAGIAEMVEQMTARGTVDILRADTGPWIIAPGARNDEFWDVLRDAVTLAPARGCHPINYKRVFWPLALGWLALALLRLFRNRQQEWARR